MEFTAKQIAEYLGGHVEGDENAKVTTFCKIENGKPGAITFLANPKYTHYIYDTKASVVLMNEDVQLERPVSSTLIRVPNAYASVAELLRLYDSLKPKKQGIDTLAFVSQSSHLGESCYVGAFAYIGEHAEIGNRCLIYPHAYIGDGVKIGDDCIIYPNVSIYYGCQLGNRVTIHSGSVIGADGFGFVPEQDGYKKTPQLGIVKIEDDVEIGANTCVDRAVMGSTVIGVNSKLDNLVQVGHNVRTGRSNVMCAQVGVAGSTEIGSGNIFAGQVGVAGHITVGDRCVFGAQSGVAGSVKKQGTYMGSPAIDAMLWRRASASFKHLPEIMRITYRK